MTWHPRETRASGRRLQAARSLPRTDGLRRNELSRRRFLELAAGTATVAGLGGLLSGCQRPGDSDVHVPLPRPDHPVRWPIFADNEPIASGLAPERGATLQIYNWIQYINTAVVENFCKEYGCSYEISTFNTMSEAISKLQSGELAFDIFFPTIDELGPLVEGKLVRPLNHDYIPNLAQTWPDYHSPFYDVGAQYTVPYTIYTTGMAWRRDYVDEEPSWSMPWNPKYRHRVGILDDYREALCLGLLKRGIHDLNTTDDSQISAAFDELTELADMVDVLIDNNDYIEIPTGQAWVHQAWSGDMAGSEYYLPKGVSPDVIGYWFPPDGKGPIANDLITALTTGHNPVLSHLFVNYMLDLPHAIDNFSFTAYMQPIEGMTAERLIELQYLPKQLSSTIVLPENFRTGMEELQLPAAANDYWEQAWLQFSGGL